jgi:hypothetical protein
MEGDKQYVHQWGRRSHHQNLAVAGRRENGEQGSQPGSKRVPGHCGEADHPQLGEETKDNGCAGAAGTQVTSWITGHGRKAENNQCGKQDERPPRQEPARRSEWQPRNNREVHRRCGQPMGDKLMPEEKGKHSVHIKASPHVNYNNGKG